ncbi:MFS transporter [Phytohabitans sp. LJ34]|uniref:MFS transporter n=1 Tax=Phytohabitans sp. LJ34 TaxID=3452217 RepID=UPI003F8CE96C
MSGISLMEMVGGRRDNAVLALVCTAQFVDVAGVTIVIVALPAIQHDLRLSDGDLSWVASIYALIFGAFLVLGGRAADMVGRRAIFMLGSATVAGGSLICAVAGDAAWLIAGRGLQGLGAAVAVPAALALLLATLPPGRLRSRALGLWTMAGAVGGASGFVIGGLVTQLAGWRWLFAAIGPLALAAVLAAPVALAAVPPRRAERGSLNITGALLCTAAVLLLILGFNRMEARGPASVWSWLPLVLAPAAGLLFVAAERRARTPLVPPALWSMRSFRLGAWTAMVLTATTSGANVIGSLFLQDDLGMSAGATGASFLLFSLSVVLGSTAAPSLLRRLTAVRSLTVGLAVVVVAMLCEVVAASEEHFGAYLAGLALSGLGLGVASVASTEHGTADADDATSGLIGGLLNAAAQIGTAIGIAVLVVTARWSGFAAGFLLAGTVALGAAAATALRTTVRVRR